MRCSSLLPVLGVAAVVAGCTHAVSPPQSPPPALLQELDVLGCNPRPKSTSKAPAASVATPEALQPMKDGRPHGTWVFFHPNGQRRLEQHYTDGLEEGVFKQWTSEGKLLGQFEMKAGTGTMMYWCDSGSLAQRTEKKSGLEDGVRRTWSCDGVLTEQGQSVAGKREGEWVQYDGAGKIVTRDRYVDNNLEGTCSRYWPDRGQTRWDRTFVRGQLDGPTAWFDDAGHKIAEGTYRAGHVTGTWTAYYADGKRHSEMVFDAKASRYTTWDPDGRQAVAIEMDAKWIVARIDGKDARSACLMGSFRVQTDWIWESPMSLSVQGIVPCSEPVPAPGSPLKQAAPEAPRDSKKVAR